jgi:hypothetical protein
MTVDLSQIRNEKNEISDFLESRIKVTITRRGDFLVLDLGEEKLPPKKVIMLLKKFLHQKSLEETYRVIVEKEAAKIVKQKHEKRQNTEKKVSSPSPYDKLPYYFPNRPRLPSRD